MRRWSADDRAFSAWLICLMPSGPVALTFTAWLRAWITASSVERSNSIAPLTAFTRLGIRSCSRLSWTSICLKALSVWFLRGVSRLDMQLDAPAHGDAVPGARALGVPCGVPRQPRRQRPARLAARRRALALERQPVRYGQGGAQRLGRAAFQHVTGLVVHLLDDRGQRRPLHLPQLDPQELEEMAVGIRGGGPASFGRAHQALGDVEPDRALARLRPCGRVDRCDRGRIEHGSYERREIAQVPRGEVAILPQVLQRLRVRRACHAPAPPRALSSPIRNTAVSQSVTSRRLNGFRITMHWCRSSQVRTSSASASPVMIAMRPSYTGQRCTMAR